MIALFREALTVGTISPALLAKIIDGHADATRYQDNYSEYIGEVDILERELQDETDTKVNQKLPNDFRGEIVDQIVGYMAGVPIAYELPKEIKETFKEFRIINNIEDLDAETIKVSSACGTSFRLMYTDEEANVRVMLCKPWTVILIYDQQGLYPQFGIRYWTTSIAIDDEFVDTVRVEVYDDRTVQAYYKAEGTYVADGDPKSHNFERVPIIEFANNDERMGDFEKVSNLVDAYDLTLSDVQNELEEFRMAYLCFTNCTIDKDTIEKARETGAFNLPRDATAEFLTKDLNDAVIEHHKTTLENNIYWFSKTVNMTDEKFSGGAMSGEARKWKLLSLENRAISKERKHTAGLRRMFEIIEFVWKAKGGAFDFKEVTFQYTRNIPVELKEASEMAKNFKGIISNKTLFGLLPFVEDVEAELKQIESEMDEIDITEDNDGQPGKEATGD